MKCSEQIGDLREAIHAGKLKPGAMIGTEFAFSREWDVSRNTVRKGIELLVDEGLLERGPERDCLCARPTRPCERFR